RSRARLRESRPPGRATHGAGAGRRRGLPRRDQGGGDRRRRRGCARPREQARLRRQRARPERRPRPRLGAARTGARSGDALTDRRHRRPLPLGGEDGLPFSKGLMARALIATGLSADRAYELAIAIEADLAASARPATTLERLEEVALATLG